MFPRSVLLEENNDPEVADTHWSSKFGEAMNAFISQIKGDVAYGLTISECGVVAHMSPSESFCTVYLMAAAASMTGFLC